jgi:hypothetical protein
MSNGGKGSRPRPFSVSQNTFSQNWDQIFNKEKNMQVRVEQLKESSSGCGCGRSPTGQCIGWHGLSEDAYKIKLQEYLEKNQTSDK